LRILLTEVTGILFLMFVDWKNGEIEVYIKWHTWSSLCKVFKKYSMRILWMEVTIFFCWFAPTDKTECKNWSVYWVTRSEAIQNIFFSIFLCQYV
jgi:hypothetical protein